MLHVHSYPLTVKFLAFSSLLSLQAVSTWPATSTALTSATKDYRPLCIKIVRRATEVLSQLEATSAQLAAKADGAVCEQQKQAGYLADMRELGEMEEDELAMMRDQRETEARLACLRRSQMECASRQRIVQEIMERNKASL